MGEGLHLDTVSLGYGRRTVLESISLAVSPGEVVALIGPNGTGKSTLIRAASGVLRPFAGRVLIGGADLRGLRPDARARRVAVVPQSVRLPEAFTVRDTVLLGRTAYLGWLGREGEADRRIADSAMERTSVLRLADRRLGELSGGEQALVLIARALAQSAPVLLLDEPTAQLDLRHESKILGLVRELAHADGRTVLVALHDLNLAAQFADRVALLAGGSVRAIGKPAEVLTAENLSAAYDVRVHVFPHPILGTPLVTLERDPQ